MWPLFKCCLHSSAGDAANRISLRWSRSNILLVDKGDLLYSVICISFCFLCTFAWLPIAINYRNILTSITSFITHHDIFFLTFCHSSKSFISFFVSYLPVCHHSPPLLHSKIFFQCSFSLDFFPPFGINFCPTISHYGIFNSRVLHSSSRDICPTKSRRPWPARDLHRWPLEMLMRPQRHRTCFPLIYFASICSYVDRSDGPFTYLNFPGTYVCLVQYLDWNLLTYIAILICFSVTHCLADVTSCNEICLPQNRTQRTSN